MRAEPAGTRTVLIREGEGWASSHELADWAAGALADGFDTPTLRILAGADLPERSEVRHAEVSLQFRQALDELGLEVPPRETTLRWHLESLARKILSGELTPRQGIDQIHREIVTPLKHPEDMRTWCYLWSGLSADGKSYFPEEQPPHVIRQAVVEWFQANGS